MMMPLTAWILYFASLRLKKREFNRKVRKVPAEDAKNNFMPFTA